MHGVSELGESVAPPSLSKAVSDRRAYWRSRAWWCALAVGALLALSTIPVGFFSDDLAFLGLIEGKLGREVTLTGLYEFIEPGPRMALDVARGALPWWASPGLQIRFFRPLASALLFADHALFGQLALGYHLHSIAWYLALLLVVAQLFRTTLGPGAALLALWIFALDDSHVEAAAWISNRHMVIAAVFGMAGLLAQIRYREYRFRAGRWLAPLLLAVGLLAGEAAVGAALYWVAYESLRSAPRSRALRARVRDAFVPCCVLIAYSVIYKLGHFGTRSSGLYLDPTGEPLAFLRALGPRIAVMVADASTNFSSALSTVVPIPAYLALALFGTALACFATRATWSSLTQEERAGLRWLLLGALLSMLVALGGAPTPRLLLLPSIGIAALFGAVLSYAWRGRNKARPTPARLARYACGTLAMLHLVLAPLNYGISAFRFASVATHTRELAASLDPLLAPGQPSHGGQVLVLTGSDPFAGFYVGIARAQHDPGSFRAWVEGSMARGTHLITRIDEQTLELRLEQGRFLNSLFERLFRSQDELLPLGTQVETSVGVFTVTEVDGNGRPRAFQVRFDGAAYRRGELVMLAWQDAELRQVQLPPIGSTLTIPWTPGPALFF